MEERIRRIRAFCENGAIGAYDADDLHSDMRWPWSSYQELRSALAMVATYEPTPDPDSWQNLSGKVAVLGGFQRLANKVLARVDALSIPNRPAARGEARMNKEKRAFYHGMLAALAVVKDHDQQVLFDEIVASADVDELVAAAQADEQMEMSGLARYGYAPCPKGGAHEWGIDGQHSNEYCKKCFTTKGATHDRHFPECPQSRPGSP